ncbi:MAG: recombination protein RecR [Gammaproteobacteria bacterium]|nr:recombination protein RecR [Gammaproteobacteria bacterium]
MKFPESLQQLLVALRKLPGVGPRSAQRMAFHLLERDRAGAATIGEALQRAVTRIVRCQQCRMFAESPLCTICQLNSRDDGLLCIVESPADVVAIEESVSYNGRYFVLHGRLSPLDGIGPAELGLDVLGGRLQSGTVREIVLATSATVEGEATAGYLAGLAKSSGVRATRIARGVPVGGELEYVDSGTLSRAMAGRIAISDEDSSF